MPAATPARHLTDVRGHNLAFVLGEVHLRGTVTRAELTESSGLNRSTIADLVNDLQTMGLVLDRPPSGGPNVGRPSHVVSARPDGPYTIAVEVDVDRLVVALVGLGGVVLARVEASLPDNVQAPTAVDTALATLKGLQEHTTTDSHPCGMGVSVAGTVRHSDGLVRSAPNLGWVDVPLAQCLATRLRRDHPGLPVRVGNDSDLGARAEHLRGAARGIDNVVYLSGHVGVGGGIIAGGNPLTGAHGFGGELGHMVIQLDGPPCRCGGRGCFEALVGSAALCALAGSRYTRGSGGPQRVFTDAGKGRPAAVTAVHTVADRLGTGLATIVNVLDPQMIVVGGLLEQVLHHDAPAVDAAMRRQLTSAARDAVTVCEPGLGGDSSLLGAAELGFDGLFETLNYRPFKTAARN